MDFIKIDEIEHFIDKSYHIRIITTKQEHCFIGQYLYELEKPNWHYYKTYTGLTLSFRKEHMIYVKTEPLSEYYKKKLKKEFD